MKTSSRHSIAFPIATTIAPPRCLTRSASLAERDAPQMNAADTGGGVGTEGVPRADAVVAFHDQFLRLPESLGISDPADAWRWIEENHRCNAALWKEEDKARRDDVPDAEIVRCK